MKVGLCASVCQKDVGGGFSFIDGVVHSLKNNVYTNEYLVFSHNDISNGSRQPLRGSTDRVVSFWGRKIAAKCRNVAGKMLFQQKRIEAIELRIGRISKHFYWDSSLNSDLDVFLKQQGIDILWQIGNTALPTKYPYIFTVWDVEHLKQPWFPEFSEGWTWEKRENYYRYFVRRAAKVTVGTQVGRHEIKTFYGVPDDKISVVPLPVPRARNLLVRPKGMSAKLLNSSEPYMFYPAQFWSHKNHVVLLDALSLLRKKHGLKIRLVLTGADKGNLSHIKSIVRDTGLTDAVSFLGFVDDDALAVLFQDAVALTYSSLFGPDNLPPLEAQLYGCPAIVADIAGAREQFGDSVLYFSPFDAAELASQVCLLVSDKDFREKLVERGRLVAKTRTVDDYLRKVDSIICEFEPFCRLWGTRTFV